MQRGKNLRILCVGKTRLPFLRDAEAFYLERLGHLRGISLDTVRDGDAGLAPAKRVQLEGSRLLGALDKADLPIALDEHGRALNSTDFAAFLGNLDLGRERPCFIIGGSHGLSKELLGASRHKIRLSSLTFTHELARMLLLEQLYRAETILRGYPYHH